MTKTILQISFASYNELFHEWLQSDRRAHHETMFVWIQYKYGVKYLGTKLEHTEQRELDRRFFVTDSKLATAFALKYT